jgi:hypothetical protein
MGGKWSKWTDAQLDYLKKYYGRIKRANLKAGLDKRGPLHSLPAIKSQAVRKGFVFRHEEKKGYVNLVDVHPEKTVKGRAAHRTCRNKARADGVLIRQFESPQAPLLVPEWWAEEYLKCYRDTQDIRDKAKREGWWSSKRLAAEIGYSPHNGVQYLLGRRGPDWWREGMGAAPKVKMGHAGLMWYVDPKHVKPLLVRWKREKARGDGRPNEGHQSSAASSDC